MAWRTAKSLTTLRNQVNAKYPNRNKASDGTIGDTAHSSRKSDHNPNSAGVVTAMDITHDPRNGVDIGAIFDRIKSDSRVKYLIWNYRIWTPSKGWYKYTGTNPHTRHGHVSVSATPSKYDNTGSWNITPVSTPKPLPTPSKPSTNEDMLTSNDTDVIRIINSEVEGYPFAETHAGKYDAQENKAWVGVDFRKMVRQKWAQGKAFREARNLKLANYDKLVNELALEKAESNGKVSKAAYDAIIADLEKANEKVQKLEAKAQEKPLPQPEPKSFWDILREAFRRK